MQLPLQATNTVGFLVSASDIQEIQDRIAELHAMAPYNSPFSKKIIALADTVNKMVINSSNNIGL